MEKGNILINQGWDDNNKLIAKINECINIEYKIKNIVEINESIEKCNSKKINIKFIPEDEQLTVLSENIKKFGKIFNEENDKFIFKFKPGNNYNISDNGLIATKSAKGGWNCVIIGDKEIPKEKISKWKIKINKNKFYRDNIDIFIGIGPKLFKNDLYNECWSIFNENKNKVQIQMKAKSSNYNNHKEELKEGDIIEVIVDRKLGNLSFAINNINYGIACSSIPKEDELYPQLYYMKILLVLR